MKYTLCMVCGKIESGDVYVDCSCPACGEELIYSYNTIFALQEEGLPMYTTILKGVNRAVNDKIRTDITNLRTRLVHYFSNNAVVCDDELHGETRSNAVDELLVELLDMLNKLDPEKSNSNSFIKMLNNIKEMFPNETI